MWLYVVASADFNYKLVDDKFILSGHSYLLNNRDFGAIEKANQHIYILWCKLVETARKSCHSDVY